MGGIFKFLIKRVVKRHTTLQSKLAIDEAAVDVDGAADESMPGGMHQAPAYVFG